MSSSLALVAFATRVAGGVLALGYLLGVVPGPVAGAVGALALMTFAKALFLPPDEALVVAGALAVLAAAAGVGAVRWGTLDLAVIRGAQGVLGPTVLVAPSQASLGAWLGAAAGVVALGVWLSPSEGAGWRVSAWTALEAALGALILVSVFWGPAVVASFSDGHAIRHGVAWAVAVVVIALPALGLSLLLSRLGRIGRTVPVVVAALVIVVAAELVVRAV